MIRMSLAVFSLIVLCPTVAAEMSTTASRFAAIAEQNRWAGDSASCSFSTLSTSQDGVFEERYDAGSGEPWQLVSVNGATPTEDDYEDYEDDADQRERRSHPLEFDMERLARSETLQLVDSNTDRLTFRFYLQPSERQDNEDFLENVQGTLVVDQASARPVRLLLESTRAFSPAPAFKIREFRQDMAFRFDPQLGRAVPETSTSHFLAKAMVFKTIADDRVVEFKDYDCRGTRAD